MNVLKYMLIPVVLFWAGFVSAISFFEAWLKFRAEGITRETGLRIGKLIFTSLNKVEIVFLALVWIVVFSTPELPRLPSSTPGLLLWALTMIMTLETFWLTPRLTRRATEIIQGSTPPPSKLHLLFILLELIKVTVLIAFYGLLI
ncbi:hypothetical protein EGM51_17520 [Verrucomicrobia bacterium S94]|nr:hypothetical protein EGM51_17520 [Verrucomicrobia bacterium S94]